MADWVTVGLSAFSSIGFGGLAAAGVNAVLARNENQRVWERDHVIERYTEALRAFRGFQTAYIDSVVPLTQQSPMPQLDAGYQALDESFGVFIDTVMSAYVVARPRVMRVLACALLVQYWAFTPRTSADGIPRIAAARSSAEFRFVQQVAGTLIDAMRADLKLVGRRRVKQVDSAIRELVTAAQISRSPFEHVHPSLVVANLQQYGVRVMPGADAVYRIPYFDEYCEELFQPGLIAQGIDAVLVEGNTEIHACLRPALELDRQYHRLRQIGITVETGFRKSPGADGWRALPDGAKAFVWTAGSPLALQYR